LQFCNRLHIFGTDPPYIVFEHGDCYDRVEIVSREENLRIDNKSRSWKFCETHKHFLGTAPLYIVSEHRDWYNERLVIESSFIVLLNKLFSSRKNSLCGWQNILGTKAFYDK